MNSEFKHMHEGTFQYLVDKANELEEPLYIDPNAGQSQRVHQKCTVIETIPRNSAAKKLLLGSGDNDMAEAIEKYINTKYNCVVVQGAQREAPLANFVSLLKCIDNVPGHYTVQDFAHEVLQLLVETPKSCAEKLEKHLEKTTRSYQKLCQDLSNEQDMNSATDFYMGAASILLDMPIMLIKPEQVKHRNGRHDYRFWQEYLLEGDERRPKKDFKICMVFNGINHYTPFYPKELGNIINTGYKRTRQVLQMYQDVKDLMKKIPKNVKINGALQQMIIHLRGAAQIAETLRFECAVGDTTPVSQLPMPLDTGTPVPSIRKRKRGAEPEDTTGEPPKQNRWQTAATVVIVSSCHNNVVAAKFLTQIIIWHVTVTLFIGVATGGVRRTLFMTTARKDSVSTSVPISLLYGNIFGPFTKADTCIIVMSRAVTMAQMRKRKYQNTNWINISNSLKRMIL